LRRCFAESSPGFDVFRNFRSRMYGRSERASGSKESEVKFILSLEHWLSVLSGRDVEMMDYPRKRLKPQF
ncbi:MAG: hypothetical protein WAL52_00120, partial [Candidatus Sulfotelmatobacter sp.]